MLWAPPQDSEEGHGVGLVGGYGKYSVGFSWHAEDNSTSILFGVDVVKLFEAKKTKLNEAGREAKKVFKQQIDNALGL
jgi:hypothetical protein